MNLKFVLLLLFVAAYVGIVENAQPLIAAIPHVAKLIANIIRSQTSRWSVIVENQGSHHAHLWCASGSDRIGSHDGIWVKPGDSLAWSFGRTPSTKFWCTLDYNGKRVGWDVYFRRWKDAPNPTKWAIRNDGVYDLWQHRIWRRF